MAVLDTVAAEPERAGDVEDDGARLDDAAHREIGVAQPIPQRAGAGVVHVEVELRDVIDQAPAAAGDVGGGAVGPGESGEQLGTRVGDESG
jgi:hypothetical protein